MRGTFGNDSAPAFAAFVARDADNADTVYGAYDELLLQLSMPTDRANLTTLSGDRRFVDRYLQFSCSLGLDYSGSWDDPERFVVTVLDATIGTSYKRM